LARSGLDRGGLLLDHGDPQLLTRGDRSGGLVVGGLGVANYRLLMSPAAHVIGRSVRIDNSDGARLTFEAMDLYPQETAKLDEFYLLTSSNHAGATLTAEWTARAGDVSGLIRGAVEIQVDPRVPTIDELLAIDAQKRAGGRVEGDTEGSN
jgi:hypothetical protein